MAFAAFGRAAAPATPGTRGGESFTSSLRHGRRAMRDLIRLRRARSRLKLERIAVVGAGAAALVVAAGGALASGGVFLVAGASLGLANAVGLPVWGWLTMSGGLLLVLAWLVARALTRPWRLSEWPEDGTREDGAAPTLGAEERHARADLMQSVQDAMTSPAGLLAAFGLGFLGTRAIRGHPWFVRTLLGLAGLGWRRFLR